MKYFLRVAGVLVLVFALYIIVGEQLVGTSGSAFVNAELTRARAPVSGMVEMEEMAPGRRVEAGVSLGNITSRAGTIPMVDALTQSLAVARAESEALEAAVQEGAAAEARVEAVRSAAQAEALAGLLEQAQVAQSRRLSAAITAPSSGLVWSTPVSNGEFVVEGDTVSYIVDCGTAFIHASVDERLYNRLSIGDIAQFRLHEGPVIEASVAILGGTGPRELYDTLAIEPPATLTDGYAVMLSAPALAGETGCLLGRTGRVVFSEGPLSFLSELWAQIGS